MIKNKIIFFVFLLGLFLFSGVVSAGFLSDSWDKLNGAITGQAISGCRDSDGGVEPEIFGYTYGTSAGGMLDMCTNAYYLRESFCLEGGGFSSKTIKCDYGCNAGKCNTKEECDSPEGCELNQNYCLDEDAGNLFEKGDTYLVKVGWYDNGSDLVSYSGTDSCRDENWIEEYICQESGKVARHYTVCPDGCKDGVCVKGEKYLEAERSNCVDSFNGPSGMERLFVRGTVSYGGDTYEDVCASKGILTEYSCDSFGLLKKSNTGCVYGCKDGACLRTSSESEEDTSSSSDEGAQEEGEEESYEQNSQGETCENEGDCTFLGEKYCEEDYLVICGNFDSDSCLETRTSVCPNGCFEGSCLEENFNEGETSEESSEKNLVAKSFEINSREKELKVFLDIEEVNLDDEDTYFVEFSYSLDGGDSFGNSVFIPRTLLNSEGFLPSLDLEGTGSIIFRANVNPDLSESFFSKNFFVESNKEDNCIQQRFRFFNSFSNPGEKEFASLGSVEYCFEPSLEEGEEEDLSLNERGELACSGCFFEGECYDAGEIKEGKYCDPLSKEFQNQRFVRGKCENNYECSSGICYEERCSDKRPLLSFECSSGCLYEGFCYSVGSREENLFCSKGLTFIPQFKEGEICLEDYECSSNLCYEGECVSLNLIQRFLQRVGLYKRV